MRIFHGLALFALLVPYPTGPRPQIHMEKDGNGGANLTAVCPQGWYASPAAALHIHYLDTDWFYHTIQFMTDTTCERQK